MRRWSRFALKFATTALISAVILIAALIAGFPVYVKPQIDELRHADAVLVIGGFDYARYPYGMSLASAGWAPNLVISNPIGPKDPWLHDFCGKQHPEFTLYCFNPDPSTTRGEAREFSRLAAEHGWKSAIVVTYRPQISRARFILHKCFPGELIMVESSASISRPRWILEYLYQSAGYIRAALEPGC